MAITPPPPITIVVSRFCILSTMETTTLQQCQDVPYSGRRRTSARSHSVSWKDVKYQILTSNVAFLFTIHAGVNLTFSNLLLNDLDRDTSSWFASMGAIGTPIGAIACGPLMDAVGRKTCNLIIALPCVGAWLLLGLIDQRNVLLLYFSRLLAGIAAGLSTSNLVYVSETSHKKYRSAFLSLLGIHFAFGILLTTLLQLVLTWKQSALFFAAFFSTVALLVQRVTPESALWLANFRGDMHAAKRSLRALNANDEILQQEWRELTANAAAAARRNAVHRDKRTAAEDDDDDGGGGGGGVAGKYGWFEPTVYKPLATLTFLILMQQLSGLYATVYYAYDIFPRLSPRMGRLLKQEAFVLFGVVRFAASVVSCCVSARLGRRTLLMASGAAMLLASTATVVATTAASPPSPWRDFAEHAATCGFVLFVGVGAVGVMTIPWTLIVELLPTEKRASGGALLISYAYLLLFVFVKALPFALDYFGVARTFAFFAVVSLLIVFFVYFFVPETLNRSLFEIESFYVNANADADADAAYRSQLQYGHVRSINI